MILKLKNWSTDKDSLSVSLMDLFARINIEIEKNELVYHLVINDSKLETISFDFDLLNEAVMFVEDYVSKCHSLQEVLDKYNREIIVLPEDGYHKELLLPETVRTIIEDYYKKIDIYNVTNFQVEENQVIRDNELRIIYYIGDKAGYEDNKCFLFKTDITRILADYLKTLGYDLLDWRIIGGFNKDKNPYYSGIEISVKKLEKRREYVKE